MHVWKKGEKKMVKNEKAIKTGKGRRDLESDDKSSKGLKLKKTE